MNEELINSRFLRNFTKQSYNFISLCTHAAFRIFFLLVLPTCTCLIFSLVTISEYEAEVEHEVRVERFEVSFNGLNDEIEYEDHEFTHLRPHNLMHVEGRRNMTDDILMQEIELIINK